MADLLFVVDLWVGGMNRPMPPAEIPGFTPAPEIFDFVQATFFNSESPVYNPDHDHLHHLEMPDLSFLWATQGFKKQGRFVLGECEKVMFQAGGWRRSRQEHQMFDWFGDVPKFLITLDAEFCRECSDDAFCALIEHELYHIGHMKDELGEPAYSMATGLPKIGIQGHDVEEFVGVVKRYGMSEDVKRLVEAANNGRTHSGFDVANACGTCLLRLA